MKNVSMKVTGAVSVLLLSSTAWSDAPLGVGSADVLSSSCTGQIVVGPPGDFSPGLDGTYGVMFIQLGDTKVVFSNSANGNRNLTCHGMVGTGDTVVGIDAFTGGAAVGTVSDRSDACSAITTFGVPSPCRGKGEKSAIIIGPEFQDMPCNIDGVPTFNWKSVFNEGGYMLSCHSKD